MRRRKAGKGEVRLKMCREEVRDRGKRRKNMGQKKASVSAGSLG